MKDTKCTNHEIKSVKSCKYLDSKIVTNGNVKKKLQKE